MIFSADATERARRVRFIIFDVDGVLTDGGIYTGESGEFMKPFNVRDGLGIRQCQNEGFGTAIITGRASAIDLAVMQQVGFPAAPADAVDEVRALSCLVAGKEGGRGAVREIIEFILKAQGRWANVVARFTAPEKVTNVSQ